MTSDDRAESADDAYLADLVCICLEHQDPLAELRRQLTGQPALLLRAERLLAQVIRLEQSSGPELMTTAGTGDPAQLWPQIPGVSLTAQIARGGQGLVFRGQHRFLARSCAVKVLAPEMQTSSFVQRFRREARMLAGLQHPHVVACFDAGIDDLGQCYLVMEWIDGPNLRQWLDQHGKMAWPAALLVVEQLTQALAHAQQRGLVHRDVKPENVLLQPNADNSLLGFDAKLADLGLARTQLATSADSMLTAPGAWVGTPATMAPEQYDSPAQVDHRADIYGLGCILHHCLTGKPAFSGRSHTELIVQKAAVQGPFGRAPIPEVPPALSQLVWQMLAHAPSRRPQTYAELLGRLVALRSAASQTKRLLSKQTLLLVATAAIVTGSLFLLYPEGVRTPSPAVTGLVLAVPDQLMEGEIATLAWSQPNASHQQECVVVQTGGPRVLIEQRDANALRIAVPLGAAESTLQFAFAVAGAEPLQRHITILPSPLRSTAPTQPEDLFPGGALGRWRSTEPQRWLAEDSGRGAVLNNPRGRSSAELLLPRGPFVLRGCIEPRFRYLSPAEPRVPVAEVSLRIELGNYDAVTLRIEPDRSEGFLASWRLQRLQDDAWLDQRELTRSSGAFPATAPLLWSCQWNGDRLLLACGDAASQGGELRLDSLSDAAAPGRLQLAVERGVAAFLDWQLSAR